MEHKAAFALNLLTVLAADGKKDVTVSPIRRLPPPRSTRSRGKRRNEEGYETSAFFREKGR